jgi:hypothetical protein
VPGFDTTGGFKMMSLNELMDAARGVSNMYLAHEIAVDKDFMLEKLKPEETELEIQVPIQLSFRICRHQKYYPCCNLPSVIFDYILAVFDLV